MSNAATEKFQCTLLRLSKERSFKHHLLFQTTKEGRVHSSGRGLGREGARWRGQGGGVAAPGPGQHLPHSDSTAAPELGSLPPALCLPLKTVGETFPAQSVPTAQRWSSFSHRGSGTFLLGLSGSILCLQVIVFFRVPQRFWYLEGNCLPFSMPSSNGIPPTRLSWILPHSFHCTDHTDHSFHCTVFAPLWSISAAEPRSWGTVYGKSSISPNVAKSNRKVQCSSRTETLLIWLSMPDSRV